MASNTPSPSIPSEDDKHTEDSHPTSPSAAHHGDDEKKDVLPTALASTIALSLQDSTTIATNGDGPTFPNGGLQAWLQVLGSFIVLANTWGVVNTFGIYQTYYEANPSLFSSDTPPTASYISWIGSLQSSLTMLLSLLSGPLHDAHLLRPMLFIGTTLIVLGTFMIPHCTRYIHFVLTQGVCIGLGSGLIFLPATAVVAQWFGPGKRSIALGMASTGSPVSGTLFPLIFSKVERAWGFGWAVRVLGFIVAAGFLVPVLTMRARDVKGEGRNVDANVRFDIEPVAVALPGSPPLSSVNDNADDDVEAGRRTTVPAQEPEHPTTSKTSKSKGWWKSPEKDSTAVSSPMSLTDVKMKLNNVTFIDKQALKDPAFLAYTLSTFFLFLGLYVAFFYIQLYAVSLGLATSPSVSSTTTTETASSTTFDSNYLAMLLNAGSILGRLLPNYLADTHGALNTFTMTACLASILVFTWLSITTLPALCAFAVSYGAFSGGIVSLLPAATVVLTPELGRVGGRMGMMCFFCGLAMLAGTPIAGAILGRTGEGEERKRWMEMIVYGGGVMMVGTVFAGASRWLVWRKVGGWKS